MPASKPLKTVVATFRMTEEEKAKWDAYCADQDVTLADALRGGLKLYERDIRRSMAQRQRRDREAGLEPSL